MTPDLERAARAHREAHSERFPWDNLSYGAKMLELAQVRATLRSLLDPSPAVVDAMIAAFAKTGPGMRVSMREAFRAGILAVIGTEGEDGN